MRHAQTRRKLSEAPTLGWEAKLSLLGVGLGGEPAADPAPCPTPRGCFWAIGIVFLEVEEKRDLGALLFGMPSAKTLPCDRHFFSIGKFIDSAELPSESGILDFIFIFKL